MKWDVQRRWGYHVVALSSYPYVIDRLNDNHKPDPHNIDLSATVDIATGGGASSTKKSRKQSKPSLKKRTSSPKSNGKDKKPLLCASYSFIHIFRDVTKKGAVCMLMFYTFFRLLHDSHAISHERVSNSSLDTVLE